MQLWRGTPERRYEGLGWDCGGGELSQQRLTARGQGNRLREMGLQSGGRRGPPVYMLKPHPPEQCTVAKDVISGDLGNVLVDSTVPFIAQEIFCGLEGV
mgnify:CR=1 FL=1